MRHEGKHRHWTPKREDLGKPLRIDDSSQQGMRSANVMQRLSALGEMTGGLTHDLRNIFAAIIHA